MTPSASRDKLLWPTSRSRSTSHLGCPTSSRLITRSLTQRSRRWTEPDSSCRRISPRLERRDRWLPPIEPPAVPVRCPTTRHLQHDLRPLDLRTPRTHSAYKEKMNEHLGRG